MIIIEGKVGKSIILENLINNRLMNRSVVVLDSVGVNGLVVPKGVDHFMFNNHTVEEIIDACRHGGFKNYEWVIFEVNADLTKIDIEHFKELDRNSTQNFIITVQTDGDIKVKFA
ncbi:hypothetical protein PQE75_gp016 [Bacillus phage vB_BcoS-136]|uniref:Uncharacterized protein n=1 Tax=Bacillus phage vB_BcoS-136 TaxID=2419619 RepID=A0A3G3BV93_9CAUD|nr:hypothetical protein PQE75_gp016 [Bacillus phage vB_BcoS-136]AYP68148.1 hypothetical protein vBBcoS136_00016 [Bacillus phage vB_BcoS-136]